jgi:MraZ protein
VFLGEYQHALDDKGRVVLPRKFRDELEKGCVITKGQEHCIYVFTMERWKEEMAKVAKLPRTDRRSRNFSRSFFAGASDQKLDRQGRVAIPENLRTFASLEKDVTVVGVADYIEIWSSSVWEEVAAEADELYAGIEEVLSEGGDI